MAYDEVPLLNVRFGSVSSLDYYPAAVLDRAVGAELLARLDLVALKPKRILNWGWGADDCRVLLQQRYPDAEIISLDDFSKAISIDNNSIDLILSNLLLPWCADLKQIVQVWRRVLRPEGLLTFTSLGPDTLQELQPHAIQLPLFIDMHNLGDALLHSGFSDPVLDVEYFTLTYREQQALQHELSVTGFIGDQVLEPLEKNTAGVIPLTYEVIYGHAWQPLISQNLLSEEGVVKIPLAHLRR